MTGRSFFGGKEKEEYYRYHNNPEEDSTEEKGEICSVITKVSFCEDIDRQVDGPIVVFDWHVVPFTFEFWRRRCLFISQFAY